MLKLNRRKQGCLLGCLGVVTFMLVCIVGLLAATSLWPGLSAQGADFLRAIFGDEAVAHLEMVLFESQDTLQQLAFGAGLEHPAAPWLVATTQTAAENISSPIQKAQPVPIPSPTGSISNSLPLTVEPLKPTSTLEHSASSTSSPSPMPASSQWALVPLAHLGNLEGEGEWAAYINDDQGHPVAYRTFLQPDLERPYSMVAVVAFHMADVRLHFVLGSIEPYAADAPPRSGKIPAEDFQPGRLLATFNGGFKATHGHFGAMSEGVIVLPPINGLGTLTIDSNGKVTMGEWGTDILPSPDILAWRQNGPLVIHDRQVNPAIYNNSPKDWGYTVDDVSPTWRSGIAISSDGLTLFYLAGSKLTMQALADSMLAAGAEQGMQLDINNYWVHFVALRWSGDQYTLDPLFPDAMSENEDRYLFPYTRDYFYITALK